MLATSADAVTPGCEAVVARNRFGSDMMLVCLCADLKASKLSIVESIQLANTLLGDRGSHISAGSL